MQKWARMLVETGKAFVDLSEMTTQIREDSDFWSLPPLTILCWWIHLVITRHLEDGHGIAQMDNTTTRLITFLWGSASDQKWTLPEHKVFQEQTLEVITTCWWWPSAFAWKKNQWAKTHKTQIWPRKAERSQCVGNLPSYDRWEVCTSHHHEQRSYRHKFSDHNTAVTETAIEILGRYCQKKKPWAIAENSWDWSIILWGWLTNFYLGFQIFFSVRYL